MKAKEKNNKKGISLIVLVITMIVPYYETFRTSKIGIVTSRNSAIA